MRSTLFSYALCLLLSACAEEAIVKKNEPAKEADGGTVRYMITGKKKQVARRRQDALKLATRYCGGPIDIKEEKNMKDFTTTVSMGPGGSPPQSNAYIKFTCREHPLPAKPGLPPPSAPGKDPSKLDGLVK